MLLGSDITGAVMWAEAAAPIQPLAQELPYATDAAIKRKRKEGRKGGRKEGREKKERRRKEGRKLTIKNTRKGVPIVVQWKQM